jgi:hypothetical protein
VAPKVAGSSPVGHPPTFRIDSGNTSIGDQRRGSYLDRVAAIGQQYGAVGIGEGKLFYAHAGRIGAAKHFPLTVFDKVPISVVEQNVSPQDPSRDAVVESLRSDFPLCYVNCWGVPTGGVDMFRRLERGDVVLIIGGATPDGLVPAMGEVKACLSGQQPHLSSPLWDDHKYRYVFFFDTEELELTWVELRDQLNFSPNYNPAGLFMPVRPERLTPSGGADQYVEMLRFCFGISHSPVDESPDTTATETVGARSTQHVDHISRHLERLRDDSVSGEPALTEGRPRAQYVRSAIPRDDAFRIGVGEIYHFKCAVCGLGISGPDGKHEAQSAHIYPKALDGKDDLRNGICLCRMHHWAFDAGWFWLNDDCKLIVRDDLPNTDDYAFIRNYDHVHITTPEEPDLKPHPVFLRAHRALHGID